MQKPKLGIEVDTDDLMANDSPKKRPQLDTLGNRRDVSGGSKFRPQLTGKSGFSGLPSTSNYGRRYGAAGGMKSPRDPRDMWKSPETTKHADEDSDEQVVETKMRVENEIQYFETAEADEVDFDEINERQALKQVENFTKPANSKPAFQEEDQDDNEQADDGLGIRMLKRGDELIDDEIDTTKAYQFFRKLEEGSSENRFKPPEYETGGMAFTGPSSQEIPSKRILRLQNELADLEKELEELALEEIPTMLKEDQQSSKHQLTVIEELRSHMHDVLDSSTFQDLEAQTKINFHALIAKKEAAASAQKVEEGKGGLASKKYESSQDLKKALAQAMAEQVARLNPKVTSDLHLTDQIELLLTQQGVFNQHSVGSQTQSDDLRREEVQKYIQVQKQLDGVEQLVGQWNPLNKFNSVFRMVNNLSEQVDEFNIRQEEMQMGAPTPQNASTRFLALQTPAGGARGGDTMSKRAQFFNDELEKLENKLATMNDVAYERSKIDFLYTMAERSLEQLPHVDLLIDRLLVLERINKESPNIENQIKTIQTNVQKRLPECLAAEKKQLGEVKAQVIDAAHQLEKIF